VVATRKLTLATALQAGLEARTALEESATARKRNYSFSPN